MFFMNAVGTEDVIKQSFLDQFSSTELTPLNIIFTLLVSAVLGFAIYFTYLKTYRGVVYSQPFNASLVLMCVITSTIILTISSNAVLSLGMVGALSIGTLPAPPLRILLISCICSGAFQWAS